MHSNHNGFRNDDNNYYNNSNNYVLWLWLMAETRKVRVHSDFIISHTLEFEVPIGYQKYPVVQGLPWTSILTRGLHCPIGPANSFRSPSLWLSHPLVSLGVTVLIELMELEKDCRSKESNRHKLVLPNRVPSMNLIRRSRVGLTARQLKRSNRFNQKPEQSAL